MLDHFSKILKENYKINDKHRLLLAVSGGLDSMVMLDLFVKAGFSPGVAHVNFQLRGEDSEKDEEFVRKAAKQYDLTFHSIRGETCQKSVEWKMSIQMAARKIRYDFFASLVNSYDYDFVCTAHHRDDNFETSLLNFIRYPGFTGLSGIPSRNENIIRPLLSMTRLEIESYAKEKGIQWREDNSNESTKYLRNKIRHDIIPGIREINPSYLDTFGETTDQLNLLRYFSNTMLDNIRGKWVNKKDDTINIDICHLESFPHDLWLFWELIRTYGFNFSQFRDIVKSISSGSGKRFETDEYLLVRDREHFIISPLNRSPEELLIREEDSIVNLESNKLEIKVLDKEVPIERNEKVALLDAAGVEFPLRLRPWYNGDKFQPLGMQGEKKISDFLIDLKIPINEKEKQYVLLSNDKILWVVGKRINHRYRVTDKTKKILRIELK